MRARYGGLDRGRRERNKKASSMIIDIGQYPELVIIRQDRNKS